MSLLARLSDADTAIDALEEFYRSRATTAKPPSYAFWEVVGGGWCCVCTLDTTPVFGPSGQPRTFGSTPVVDKASAHRNAAAAAGAWVSRKRRNINGGIASLCAEIAQLRSTNELHAQEMHERLWNEFAQLHERIERAAHIDASQVGDRRKAVW